MVAPALQLQPPSASFTAGAPLALSLDSQEVKSASHSQTSATLPRGSMKSPSPFHAAPWRNADAASPLQSAAPVLYPACDAAQLSAASISAITPDLATQILNDLTNADLSFREVAARHNIEVPALSLWLSRPDIAERLFNMDSLLCRRARLIVADTLPLAARALVNILKHFEKEQASFTEIEPADFPRFLACLRSRENARNAATLLLRIARIEPLARRSPLSPNAPAESTAAAQDFHEPITPGDPQGNPPRPPQADPIAQALALVSSQGTPSLSMNSERVMHTTSPDANPAQPTQPLTHKGAAGVGAPHPPASFSKPFEELTSSDLAAMSQEELVAQLEAFLSSMSPEERSSFEQMIAAMETHPPP